MRFSLQGLTTGTAVILCCFLVMTLPATAEMGSDQDGWTFTGSAYFWASGVKGTDSAGDEMDVSFSDILEDLDGGLMGLIIAKKGKWMLFADMIYLSISQEINTTANIIGNPLKSDVDVNLKGFISTFGVAYRILEDDVTNLDLILGARYFRLDLDIDTDIGGIKNNYSSSDDVLDGIIGTQIIINLSEKWYLSCYADVGTGDSKLTWQAWPGIGYQFEKFDVIAGYRHLAWETDDGDAIDDLSFSGPTLGLTYRF
jgi:hypothetical protein